MTGGKLLLLLLASTMPPVEYEMDKNQSPRVHVVWMVSFYCYVDDLPTVDGALLVISRSARGRSRTGTHVLAITARDARRDRVTAIQRPWGKGRVPTATRNQPAGGR